MVGVEYLLAVEFALGDESGHVRVPFCKTGDFGERPQALMPGDSLLCVGEFRFWLSQFARTFTRGGLVNDPLTLNTNV